MKKICTLLMLTGLMLTTNRSQAGNVYNVTSDKSWSSAGYSSSNSTFNISDGVTLTINQSFTCSNCTFNGGNIVITQDVTCQPCAFSGNTITMNSHVLKPNSGTTTFSGVDFTISGTGNISANTPVTVTNSYFTFNNTAYFFNNGGQLDLTASRFYFNNNAYFYANAGPINLKSNSRLIAGDGSVSSKAYLYFNSAASQTLTIYDNLSSVGLANKNNYYFNWSAYKSVSNSKTYSPASPPYQYGCGILNSAGISSCTILSAKIADFTGIENHGSVNLQWTTSQEINTSYFGIERSADGINWESIGTVHAKGYSATSTDYHFTDASPLSGANYYRLQTVDLDARAEYSEVITVKTVVSNTGISIFPNPIANLSFNLKLSSADASVVNVFTMEGRLVHTVSLKGQLQYQIKLPASAAYSSYLVIQIINNGKTQAFTVLNK